MTASRRTLALIRIAQISDLHVKPKGALAYGRVDTAAALDRLVAALNALAPAPDAIVATGDLVDGGTAEEYAHLLELLAPLRPPLLVCPGNHDARAPLRAAFPGQAFAGTEAVNTMADIGGVRVALLDSSVPGRPEGHLDAETLAWLDAALTGAGARPALVFLHHPPFAAGIWHMDRQNLTNAAELESVLARHANSRLVGCGHVHRFVATTLAGIPAMICPGASHAVALDLDRRLAPSFALEPPGFLLHEVDAATGATRAQLVPIGPFEGPYPFFGGDGRLL